jgi:hypothetical protein
VAAAGSHNRRSLRARLLVLVPDERPGGPSAEASFCWGRSCHRLVFTRFAVGSNMARCTPDAAVAWKRRSSGTRGGCRCPLIHQRHGTLDFIYLTHGIPRVSLARVTLTQGHASKKSIVCAAVSRARVARRCRFLGPSNDVGGTEQSRSNVVRVSASPRPSGRLSTSADARLGDDQCPILRVDV